MKLNEPGNIMKAQEHNLLDGNDHNPHDNFADIADINPPTTEQKPINFIISCTHRADSMTSVFCCNHQKMIRIF